MAEKAGEERRDALAEWTSKLGEVISKSSNDFAELFPRLQRCRTELRVELARAIQPSFNAYIKMQPQETFEEKQALAARINHVMRVLDLSLRCPKTGEPAILLAEDAYKGHPKPRFRFQGKGVAGRLQKTNPSFIVPELELIPAPFREEGSARWSERDDVYRGPRDLRER